MVVLAIVAILLIAVLLAVTMNQPKPEQQESQALSVPTTKVGTPIPILFGKKVIKQPSVVWYGDVKIKKIKVSTKGKK